MSSLCSEKNHRWLCLHCVIPPRGNGLHRPKWLIGLPYRAGFRFYSSKSVCSPALLTWPKTQAFPLEVLPGGGASRWDSPAACSQSSPAAAALPLPRRREGGKGLRLPGPRERSGARMLRRPRPSPVSSPPPPPGAGGGDGDGLHHFCGRGDEGPSGLPERRGRLRSAASAPRRWTAPGGRRLRGARGRGRGRARRAGAPAGRNPRRWARLALRGQRQDVPQAGGRGAGAVAAGKPGAWLPETSGQR